jgi:ADP-heptose:LPS heptosyltransferase
MLAGTHTITHRRLAELAPAALYSVDPRPQDGAARHITQQWQTQLEAQGLLVPKCIHQRPTQRGLRAPLKLRARGRELLPRGDRAAVVIHPGSGGRGKCWPLANFCDVARRLQAKGANVVFVVGPVELERWPAVELVALEREFALCRSPSADHLVAMLAATAVFVGNDAGPTHLAALLGTPTVAIFGRTSAPIWRPLGSRANVVVGDPQAHPDTWGIAPDLVASVVVTLL